MFEMSVTALEGPRAFHKRAIEMPELGPEDVWVEVHAVGCNYADMLMTWGKYQRRLEPPFVPGFEAAGVVLRVGAAVKGVAPGDRVLSLTDWGAYATHVRAHQNHVFKIPTSLAFEQAVALGVTYQTAWVALVDRVALKKNETVLVTAAAGGVGVAVVQLAKALGAKVIGTAGSDDKCDLVIANGAQKAINYRTPNWHEQVLEFTNGRGVDVVCESVGGEVFNLALKCLGFGGRLAVIGFAGGEIPQVGMNRVLLKNISLVGLHWGAYFQHQPEVIGKTHDALMDLFQRGAIQPVIGNRFALEQAGEALEALAKRDTTGKVVLTVKAN